MTLNPFLSRGSMAALVCIVLFASCGLKEDLNAAQNAAGAIGASETSVNEEISSSTGHIIHLSFGGLSADGADTRALASSAAAIFYTSLKKPASFDSMEVTLTSAGAGQSSTVSYMYNAADIKRACHLYEQVVQPSVLKAAGFEQLKAYYDTGHVPDSAILSLQHVVLAIEKDHGKITSTSFRGFMRGVDSTGERVMMIRSLYRNSKNEPIGYCKYIFRQQSDKITSQQMVDLEPSGAPSKDGTRHN